MIQVIGQATQSNGGSPSWTLTGICKSASRTAVGTYTVTIDYLGALGIDSKDKLTILISAERGNLGTERYILDWLSANTFRVRNYTARNNQTLGDCMLTITILAEVNPIRLGFSRNTLVFPKYKFFDVTTDGGYIEASNTAGYPGELNALTGVPVSDAYKCSGFSITGASLTGNEFKYGNSNVSALALFEHSKDLTLVPNEHGTLSADKMSGFSGDIVTVDATTDEGWYFTGLNVTGATATGNQFMFVGENVTAEGLYTDAGYPITYLSDDHVHLTGDQIYIPGSEGITLDSGYDTYYRISGYDITGGSIVDGKLVPTGPCTIKAVEKINYFTATGRWFNMTTNSTGGIPYYAVSLCTYKTDNTPSNFLVKATAGSRTTNSGWQGGACSGYKLSTNSISRPYKRGSGITGGAGMRLYVGGTTLFSQNFGGSYNWEGNITAAAKTTTTTGLLKYNIVNTISYQYGRINDSNTAFNWTATGIAP